MNNIFSTANEYKTLFNKGLATLAQDKSLGTFILAMANATFSNEVYAVTKDYLQQNFNHLKQKYIDDFSEGRKVNEVDEDLLVFLKMLCVGFDNLKTTLLRDESGWELQFNHLRGFRPNRITQLQIDNLVLPFSAAGFNFNKPFMAKERLWEGEYNNRQLSLYYNKYPFAHYHTLLVPEREKGLPQFLEFELHEYMWELISVIAENIAGAGIGYNSRGAFSSVNHLHFQFFIRDEPLPVMREQWLHNGGTVTYPTTCEVFTSLAESRNYLEHLHNTNTAYNLLYTPGRLYCFPRNMQGSYKHAEWTPGFSWYELSGGILTANHDSFTAITAADIENEFNLL